MLYGGLENSSIPVLRRGHMKCTIGCHSRCRVTVNQRRFSQNGKTAVQFSCKSCNFSCDCGLGCSVLLLFSDLRNLGFCNLGFRFLGFNEVCGDSGCTVQPEAPQTSPFFYHLPHRTKDSCCFADVLGPSPHAKSMYKLYKCSAALNVH